MAPKVPDYDDLPEVKGMPKGEEPHIKHNQHLRH